jgi:hypothetical protein
VDEGVAFCPQCNAPQIRVAGAEPDAYPGTTPDVSVPLINQAIEWGPALSAIAFAAVVAAALVVMPLGGFGLGTLSAGFLSVLLYRRRNSSFNPTPGMGAKLGAISGAVAFSILTVFLAIWAAVFHTAGEIRQTMMDAVEQSAARSSNPQQAQQALEFLKTPAGFSVMMIVGLVVTLVAFLIVSAVGGALGAVLLRRKNRF